MRTSRTATVLIIAVALLIVWAIPAGAGKPAPELVKVTMELVPGSTQGFTTDCIDTDGKPIELVMVPNQDGLRHGDEDPILGVHMDDVEWTRWYPEPDSDTGFSECHGGLLEGSMEMDTYMQISMDRKTGAVTDLVWHFDRYYIDGVPMELPNGKTRDNGMILENFSLIGHDLGWDDESKTVSGEFELKYYLRDDTGTYVGSEPVNALQEFEFTIKTSPVG